MRALLLFAAFLCLPLPAPNYPDTVEIYFKNSKGEHQYATAVVQPWLEVPIPIPGNDRSVITAQAFRLLYKDLHGKTGVAATTDIFLRDYEQVARQYADRKNVAWEIPRSTGGFSAGTYQTPLLLIEDPERGPPVAKEVAVKMSFSDFERADGTSKGDPLLTSEGVFVEMGYGKPFRTRKRGEQFEILGLGNEYSFPNLEKVGMAGQRFLIDFGRNPFSKDQQLLYPVYVDRFEGENAILVAPHEYQKLQRAKSGEVLKIAYWMVPSRILRVAPDSLEGDELLKRAGTQFIDDLGKLQERNLPIETIIRANRHNADHLVDVSVAPTLEGTVANLRQSILGKRKSGCGPVNQAAGS